MDRSSSSSARRRPLRQAHRPSQRRRLFATLVLPLGALGLAVATIGAVAASGSRVVPTPSFEPVAIAARSGPSDGESTTARDATRRIAGDRQPPVVASLVGVDPSVGRTEAVDVAACGPLAPSATATPPPPAAPTITPDATNTIPRPVAAFLGDSYTTGWAGAGIGKRGWASLVATERGWRVVNRAVAGTGFVNPGWTKQPLATQVTTVVKARPGIVFVAAGHNDRRFGPAATEKAAAEALGRLRRELPDAVIVVIGPIWQSGSPPQAIRGIRDRLQDQAQRIDAVFIDPLRDGWFAGAAERLILSDGIHPSDEGHRRIAALVSDALEGDARTTSRPVATAPPPASPDPTPEPAPLRSMPACRR